MTADASFAASLPSPVPPTSLAEFVERNQAPVFRACMAVLRRADLAEDAAQETFLAVLREGGLAPVLARGRAWLHRVAVNASLQVLRAERRRNRRDLAAGRRRLVEAEAAPGPEQVEAHDRRVVRREIEALPARWRLPILLRFEEGLAYREIAVALEVPEGTVASRLHEGLERLRAALARAGLAPVAGGVEAAIALLPPYPVPATLVAALRALATQPATPSPARPRAAAPRPVRPARLLAIAAALIGVTAALVLLLRPGPPPLSSTTAQHGRPVSASRTSATPEATGESSGLQDAEEGAAVAAASATGPAAAASGLRGWLVDEQSGRPVAGARLRLSPLKGMVPQFEPLEATSDADGGFAFPPVESLKDTWLAIRADGFTERTVRFDDFDQPRASDRTGGERRTYGLETAWEAVVLVLGPGGKLLDEGVEIHLDSPRGMAIGHVVKVAGATWRVGPLSPTLDPPDQVEVTVLHPDYGRAVVRNLGSRLVGRRAECTVVLSEGGILEGIARDPAGRALPGLRLTALPDGTGPVPMSGQRRREPKYAETDAQGRFALRGLPEGTLQLWARGATHVMPEPMTIRLAEGEHRPLALVVPEGGVIEAVAVDEEGTPQAACRLDLEPAGGGSALGGLRPYWSGVTDAGGRCRIAGLPMTLIYRFSLPMGMRAEVVRAEPARIEVRLTVPRHGSSGSTLVQGDEGQLRFGK